MDLQDDIRKQIELSSLDESIERIETLIKARDIPKPLHLGILLALMIARELRDGKAPGTDTAPRVAEWVDHFGGGSVDEAVLYARHFLLKPKELVGDIESKLDAAKAKGGEDLQATADAEDEALEGMAPLDQDEACGCDDEGCACEDDEVDRK